MTKRQSLEIFICTRFPIKTTVVSPPPMYDCQNIHATFVLDSICTLLVHGLTFLSCVMKSCIDGINATSAFLWSCVGSPLVEIQLFTFVSIGPSVQD